MLSVEEYKKNSVKAQKMSYEDCRKAIELQDAILNIIFNIYIDKIRESLNKKEKDNII